MLSHIGAGKRLFLGGFVLGLGLAELLFILVQLLAGFGKLHIGVELLLGKAAQRFGELGHHAGHVVHGLDGIFQRLVDDVQAFLQLQFVCQIRSALALRAGLGVDAVLQGLQGTGKLIGDIAQLGHDLDEGVDIPHTGAVELIQNALQTGLHLDESLLHLGLLDHGDQVVDALQQRFGLFAHHLYGAANIRAQGTHDRVGHGIAKIFELLIVFCTAGCNLGLGILQLGVRRFQLAVDELHQLFVDGIHLFLIQLHLHQLLHKAAGGHAGHTALALDVGGHGVLDEIRKVVHRTALAADSHGHKGVHVHAVLHDRRSQCGLRQVAFGLIQFVGHLHQCAVHVRVIHELHQQQAVVFGRGGGDLLNTGHRKRILQHVRDLGLHTLRAGAGIHGDHHQVRCADIRQQVGLHLGDRHKAEHQHHDDCNQHRKWFFDTEFFHLILPFLCRTARRNSSSLFMGQWVPNIPIIHARRMLSIAGRRIFCESSVKICKTHNFAAPKPAFCLLSSLLPPDKIPTPFPYCIRLSGVYHCRGGKKLGMYPASVLALSVTYGDSSPKGRALGSPRKLHLFAKASPFGRGGTA